MAKSNHKDFDNKKDAIAFLKNNALMSVGWPEGNEQKVSIYWNGRLRTENAKTKKVWGSMNDVQAARELVAAARELTSRTRESGGWGSFSEDLSDILEALPMVHKGKNNREIIRIVKRDKPLVEMMKEEGMTDRDLNKLLDESRMMYGRFGSSSDRTAADQDLEAVAEVVENNGFMNLDRPLKAIGMRHVDFKTYDPPMPAAMWKMITRRGKKIVIVNKKYADATSQDIVVDDFVIGYM